MTACHLTRVHGDPLCTFKATPGQVTLQANATAGSVQFIDAMYNGERLGPLPSTRITFTIVAGRTALDVTYVFSDAQNGAGTLSELCDSHSALIDVDVQDNPCKYHICA